MPVSWLQILGLDGGMPGPASPRATGSGLTPMVPVGCKQGMTVVSLQGLCQAETCLSPKPPLAKALGQLVRESNPTIQGTPSHHAMGVTIRSDLLALGQLVEVPTKGSEVRPWLEGAWHGGQMSPVTLLGLCAESP